MKKEPKLEIIYETQTQFHFLKHCQCKKKYFDIIFVILTILILNYFEFARI